MTTAKHRPENLSVRWNDQALFPVDKTVIYDLGRVVERVNDSIRRSALRRMVMPKRASKGWRKHVRRMKAADRRLIGVSRKGSEDEFR